MGEDETGLDDDVDGFEADFRFVATDESWPSLNNMNFI